MVRPRIYADFLGAGPSPRFPDRESVPLDTFGSVRDLSNAGIRLHDGVRLSIYADSDEAEDIVADATVYYDLRSGFWHAELERPNVSYMPRCDDAYAGRFLCVACRSDLPVGQYGRPVADRCASCGTPWLAAIAAPGSPPGNPAAT